jgi:hypothetical protein
MSIEIENLELHCYHRILWGEICSVKYLFAGFQKTFFALVALKLDSHGCLLAGTSHRSIHDLLTYSWR